MSSNTFSTTKHTRRNFIAKNIAVGITSSILPILETYGNTPTYSSHKLDNSSNPTPAFLGGSPSWSKDKWPVWPRWIPETDEDLVLKVLRSGVWSRDKVVSQFEKEWANVIGTTRCLTVVNGTNSLITALNVLGVGAGDEVLVPPYTFVATVAAVLQCNAIPVFVDIDPLTYQMDPKKIEAKITKRTKVILPVHILGLPADMTSIMHIAKKHKLLVLEDACQAHLAEVSGKKVGSIGNAGCFSFQNSKNLPIGEGGAITSNDDKFMDRCFSYTNLGAPYGTAVGAVGSGWVTAGTKIRFSEYQAAVGIAMLKRLDAETTLRNDNAKLLSSLIKDIPGITPQQNYKETTRGAYHLYAFRYDQKQFKGLPRATFIKALQTEGVPASPGYTPLNTQPFLADAFSSTTYKSTYSPKDLDIKSYNENNQCPENDKLCAEAVWFTQNLLLSEKSDIELIAAAVHKIYKNAEKILNLSK